MKKQFNLLLVLTILFTSIFSTNTTFATQVPIISPWAIKTVDAAQKSGLYPMMDYSKPMDFRKPITKEELTELDKKADEKLAKYNLTKSTDFKEVKESNDLTRKEVITKLYNSIALYDAKANKDPVKYFQEHKVLSGSTKGLALDEKASLEMALTFYNRAVDKLITENGKGSEGFLYKIEKDNTKVYLLGSIHVGNSDMYPMKKSINEAYKSADKIFVEINVQNPTVLTELTKKMTREPGSKTLKEELGEDYYNKLTKFAESYGIPAGTFDNQKTWAIVNTLSTLPMLVNDPTSSAYGIDSNFLTLATIDGVGIGELENVDTQVKALSSLSNEEYIKQIKEVLDMNKDEYLKKGVKEINELKKAWIEGDAEKLTAALKSDDPSIKALFETRDPAMAETISKLLKQNDGKTYFVIAGSGHFVPEGSVRTYLEKMGYKVELVK